MRKVKIEQEPLEAWECDKGHKNYVKKKPEYCAICEDIAATKRSKAKQEIQKAWEKDNNYREIEPADDCTFCANSESDRDCDYWCTLTNKRVYDYYICDLYKEPK